MKNRIFARFARAFLSFDILRTFSLFLRFEMTCFAVVWMTWAYIVHATAKRVILPCGKNENVCEMSKNEKCTCKACKTIVFHCQICKFVTFLLASLSWCLKQATYPETGSEHLACQIICLSHAFKLIFSTSKEILRNINVVVWRQVKQENCSLPVVVLGSKASLALSSEFSSPT